MIAADLEYRFGEAFDIPEDLAKAPGLGRMAARGSCREFSDEPVPDETIRALCALALCTPTKSDLQQRDIVVIDAPEVKAAVLDLVSDQAWIANVPCLVMFCGNNRRQRRLHDMRGHDFANDHLDAFFNAAVDAGIALAGFVTAAEAIGLGCCPISAVRNRAAEVSDLLNLPDHVFPVAGLAFGHPARPRPEISPRLPLGVTLHRNRYAEDGLEAAIEGYDARRARLQPYARQRREAELGHSDPYTWSEDKTRQYSLPERREFGAFIKSKGFSLD